MTTRKKVYLFIALVGVIGAAAYFLQPLLFSNGVVSRADSTEEAKNREDEPKVPVEIAVASKGEIAHSIESTANLRPRREVELRSQAEGTAQEVLAEEGDFVRKGQVLCRLDDTQYQIRLQSSKQKLAQAKLQLEKAKILQEKSDVQLNNTKEEFQRYSSLYKENLVSEREVAQVKYRMDELEHDVKVTSSESRELVHKVEELEADIEQSELEIARTRIRAPFAGYITERSINLGQSINSSDPLYKLADFSPLLAEVFLSEREASEIVVGQPALIHSGVDSSMTVEGKVARISPIVDQSTGTVKTTVELKQARRLFKPGAFVRVAVQTDSRSGAVLVPKRAVLEEDDLQYVFLAKGETATRVQITTGYETDREVEILSGVTQGDRVIVAGQGALKEGSAIKAVGPDSEA